MAPMSTTTTMARLRIRDGRAVVAAADEEAEEADEAAAALVFGACFVDGLMRHRTETPRWVT